MALVNLFMSSSVKEELASPNPDQKSLWRMLRAVKGTMIFWPIIPQYRKQLGKSSAHIICYKKFHINYLFHLLSSHMEDWQDNEAVWFGFEFTSYI
jgi:hypothetical protein